MEKITISDINMNYFTLESETNALVDISFSIVQGDFISIVGPSGCGKSTLLNIISGLIKPTSGKVYIDNEEVNAYSPKIGYMFQRDHLFNWYNVYNNITLGLKIKKDLTNENKKRIDELLKKYDLWNFRNSRPNELSGGMRQRVALIRTLSVNPEVLLLDEPFSALDYQTRLNTCNHIFSIIKNEKKTAIMVTHDLSEAISMSNKIIVLSKRPGKIRTEMNINFEDKFNTPILRREAPEFRIYFNNLWKEMDTNE